MRAETSTLAGLTALLRYVALLLQEAGAPPANLRPVSESARGFAGIAPAVALETIFGRAFDHRQIQPRT
jgi:hypothetical protein